MILQGGHLEKYNEIIRLHNGWERLYIKPSDLYELKSLIDCTLDFYAEYKIDDEFVRKANCRVHEEAAEEYNRTREPKEKIKKEDNTSLYLIFNPQLKHIKIGKSKNPEKRLKQLQISTSGILKIVAVYEGLGWNEKNLHSLFEEYRVKSEWFLVSEAILKHFNLKESDLYDI